MARMVSKALHGTALTLTALGLAPGAAHVMELPVKLGYPPEMYAQVTSTLYMWYGIAGGCVQVAALLTVVFLAYRTRHLPAGRLAAVAAASLLASLLVWGFVVSPVNSAWAEVASSRSSEFVSAYSRLRSRWEFGHVAAFIGWLTGWFGLVAAVRNTP